MQGLPREGRGLPLRERSLCQPIAVVIGPIGALLALREGDYACCELVDALETVQLRRSAWVLFCPF